MDDMATSHLLERLAEELEENLGIFMDLIGEELIGELPVEEWNTIEAVENWQTDLFTLLEVFQVEHDVWLDVQLAGNLIITALE